jgi:hypothetical protein
VPDRQLEALRFNQLRKQFLYLNEAPNFYEITKHHLGLHSTDYWTPYFSAFSRKGDYSPDEIFESLNKGDRLVRINAFRGTNFLVHIDNLSFIYKGTAPYLLKRGSKVPPLRGLTIEEIECRITEIVELVEENPLTLREMRKIHPNLSHEASWLVKLAMAKGILIRATAKHAKSNVTSYAQIKKWAAKVDLNQYTTNKAQEIIIERYISIFGPVSVADIAWWLPLSKTLVQDHLNNLHSKILNLSIGKKTYYMTHDDYETAASLDLPKKPVISFLPYEDHFPKAYNDRSFYIPEHDREKVFPKSVKSFWPEVSDQISSTGPNVSGEIRPSIWLNHTIIGRWELEKTKKQCRIGISIFHDLPPEIVSRIKEKKEHLESFVNDRLLPIS